ncbi:MAG: helicase-related protein, partial [Bdellovibrionota bacterium]
QNLEKVHKTLDLNLNSVGLCVVYELQNIAQQQGVEFASILKALPQERVQKVFLSNENNPKTRELAFTYLDDLEYFYLLPCYVQDRSPKQFAHALTVTQKFQVLLGHLKNHKPACATVFANTRSAAEWIAYKLHGNGIKVELVVSNLNFSKKQQLVKSVKSGDINVIVTTDYHSSTLGLENLNCLYQFDLPDSAEKFIDRLNLIEKSKSPISVSFICEDYGYNMGKIENKLGFKMHVNHPDKDYFNIKDVSDYPLEADGRVKRIGQVYTTPAPVSAPTPATASFAMPAAPVVAQVERPSAPLSPPTQPRMQPRPVAVVPPVMSASAPKANFEQKPYNTYESKPQDKHEGKPQDKYENTSRNKYQDKFIRRDDKAKDALDSARIAAQEKRNTSTSKQQTNPASKNVLFVAVHIMQDALKAASQAAKQSISTNIEQNLPLFASVLSKVPFLKKSKEG